MGSLTNRGGRWTARVRRQGYPTQTRTFDRKVEAQAWVRELESRMDRSLELDPRSKTDAYSFHEALGRYLVEVTVEKKGAEDEAYRIRSLQRSMLAGYDLARIRGAELTAWRNERLRTCKPGTVLRDLNLISHLYTVAIKEWGLELVNPVALIRKPKVSNTREVRITPSELDRIVAYLSPEMGDVVRFAVETGMRRSEILGMRADWVEGALVRIPDTKNGRPRRIPLSQAAQDLLAHRVGVPGGQVWTVQHDSVSHAFKRGAIQAGCPALRFHDLRHEAISRWFEKGLSLMEVQLLSGHQTLSQLLRYTHLRPESLVGRL